MSTIGNVQPLTGYIGAEISGMDLRRLDPPAVDWVRQTLLEHQVLFFPRQGPLSPDELLTFGEHFGEVHPLHGGLKHHPDNPRVMEVVSRKGVGGSKYNASWHSDVSFDEAPPMGSILHAVELPPRGGDTLFASMYAAYESLSEPIRCAIEDLQAFHDGVPSFSTYLQDPAITDGLERLRKMKAETDGFVHPVVITHPESGRKALFVNRSFTQRLIGLSTIESRNLLNLLFDHAEQPSFQVRWRWNVGDVTFWDNRCTMHHAAYDFGLEDRVMHRVTIKGERPHA